MSESPAMFEASFGGVLFDCISTSDGVTRNVAEHEFPRRDGAHLQDMGSGARRTRLRCIFYDTAPEGDDSGLDYRDRYEIFYAKANSGETLIFTHPIFGSYPAKVVGEIGTDASADDLDALMVECTFVEDGVGEWINDNSASQPVDAGIASVKVEAAKLDQALAADGLTSTVSTETVEQVSAWRTDETITTRKVNLQLQSLTNKIATDIDRLELATNLERQPIWRSMQKLQGVVRRAAQYFQQSDPQIFSFTVRTSTPLRVIAVDLYGAKESDRRYQELMTLNDIADPMLIEEGTILKAASPNAQRGRGLRSAL